MVLFYTTNEKLHNLKTLQYFFQQKCYQILKMEIENKMF